MTPLAASLKKLIALLKAAVKNQVPECSELQVNIARPDYAVSYHVMDFVHLRLFVHLSHLSMGHHIKAGHRLSTTWNKPPLCLFSVQLCCFCMQVSLSNLSMGRHSKAGHCFSAIWHRTSLFRPSSAFCPHPPSSSAR